MRTPTASRLPGDVHRDERRSFFADDQVQVTGAFVTHDGEVALWARQITKNGKTLTLRSPDGTPRWPYATADDPDGCGVSHAPVRY